MADARERWAPFLAALGATASTIVAMAVFEGSFASVSKGWTLVLSLSHFWQNLSVPLFVFAALGLATSLVPGARDSLIRRSALGGLAAAGLAAYILFGILWPNKNVLGAEVLVTAALAPSLWLAVDEVHLVRPIREYPKVEALLGWILPPAYFAAALLASAFNHELLQGTNYEFHRGVLVSTIVLAFLGARRLFLPSDTRALAGSLFLAVLLPVSFGLSFLAPPGALADFRVRTLAGESHFPFSDPAQWEIDSRELPAATERAAVSDYTSTVPLQALEAGDFEGKSILFVVVEALRYDQTSIANPELNLTPNLAKLAERGFTAANAYAPSCSTLQTTSAILTMVPPSMAPLDVWRRRWRGELRAEAQTVPELLAANGYRTFWVGHDIKQIFNRELNGLHQGFAEVDLVVEAEGENADGKLDTQITDAAIRRIERTDSPSFGYIFYGGPHDAYLAHDFDLPKETPFQRYRHELKNTDREIGRLFDFLRTSGRLESTIIVVTGDHGEEFGEHGSTHHARALFDESTNVPFIVHAPGIEPHREDRPLATRDFFPFLFLRLGGPLGAHATEVIETKLAPLARATGGAVVVELLGWKRMKSALVWPGHKTIYDFPAAVADSYDLDADPGETVPNALSDQTRQQLRGYLEQRARSRGFVLLDK